MDVLDRLSTLLITWFGVPKEEVHAGATLVDLDLDSLALVEFGLVVQREFGVKITESEVSTQDTVDTVVRLIETKTAGAA